MKKTIPSFLPLLVCLVYLAPAQESRRGSYRAQTEVMGDARTAQALNQLHVHITDDRGNSLYSVSKSLPYDVGPPAIGVFESGASVLLDAFHGVLEFYGPSGSLLRTASLFKNPAPELERQMPFAVDDRSIVLATSEPGSPFVRMYRFTDEGDQIFESVMRSHFATGVVISNSGTLSAVGTASWQPQGYEEVTVMVSATGDLDWRIPIGMRFGAFADDDASLFATNGRTQALISVVDGSLVESLAMDEGSVVLDVQALGGSFQVLCAQKPSLIQGQWIYAGPSVTRIDPGGVRQELHAEPGREFKTARLQRRRDELLLEIDGILQSIR